MPGHKKKPSTLSSKSPNAERESSALPEQEDLRQLAVSAVQVLIEQVMREELEACIAASWGECTPTRRG